jgi:hypothetical protein
VSTESQDLLNFVAGLPEGFAYAPIYVKDSKLQSGKVSKGKTPLEKSHHSVLTPADVALQIHRKPEIFRAVGVFTGARSKGLVILDVDRNLSKLLKKWGDTLEGAPKVTSTKANAAKYLYYVPEALWGEVSGFGLSDTGAGYEVLWGRQGLLYGAYPGSSDGKGAEGFYGFEGDLEAIPEAPAWLLAEMKDHAGKGPADGGFIKNRKALDFSDRAPEEVAEIIQSALRVIPGQGGGSRDHWIKVGMAIHSELPTDLGLAWSADDPEFADDWTDGNPCEDAWKSFKRGSVSLGTLFWLADQQLPGRLWLSEDLRSVVTDAEADNVTRIRQVSLPFAEVIRRGKEIQQLKNSAEGSHLMNVLSLEAGYRDAGAVERLLISQLQFEQGDGDMDIGDLLDKDIKLDYLIPDLLPMPGLVMIHGAGGDGKSMTAWTIAKHVARGLPFSIRGEEVPVRQGKVLILNGDQSEVQIKQQMQDLELGHGDPIRIVMGWDMNWYWRFKQLVELHQPALVIIDSITGCSRGSAFDENRKEFASPLYWLANNNGRVFPACTILVVHHSNKTGGFRGTTALRDACDEVWSLRKPSDKEMERVGFSSRLVTIDKSRAGRGGSKLLLKMLEDLTFELKDYVEITTESAEPASIIDRVLQRLRSAAKTNEGRTREELNSDPICGGSVMGIKKALQRLEARGLVSSTEEPSEKRTGRTKKRFFALLARDMCQRECPLTPKTSLELDSLGGQGVGGSPLNLAVSAGQEGEAPEAVEQQQNLGVHAIGCPPETPCSDAVFAQGDTISVTPQGNLRSSEELEALKEAAARHWA